MNYASSTIGALLSRLNRYYFIPGIQRPYVWEPEQIIKLFDSLMRGYPINTFLFWELQPENHDDWDIYRFVSHFQQGNIHNESAELPTDQSVVLVLDGQQRLTSMLIGLAGSYKTRFKHARKHKDSSWVTNALYLDLLRTAEEGDIDLDEAAVRETYYAFKFADAENPPKASKLHIWFRVGRIMDIASCDQLEAAIEQELLLHPHLNVSAQAAVRANLTRLYEVVWKQDCIAYYTEHGQSYDKVLDIFIRANDGGTKLSKSDMLMSMVTLRWERVHAREATEILTYHLRDTLKQEKSFDRDYLLRAGLFFNDLNFAFKISNFTPRNIAFIESSWPAVEKALRMSADLFRRAQITGSYLTASNAVMLIACYVYKLNRDLPLDQWDLPPYDEERIRRWIVAVLFHGVLGGAANVTMELYRQVLNQQLRVERRFPVAELVAQMTRRGRVMNFDGEAVKRFVALDAKGRLGLPCLSLLYDRTDWSAEPWNMVPVMPQHRLVEDRLFSVGVPEHQISDFQSRCPHLANTVLMTKDEASEYHQLDFKDWVTSRSDAWLQNHLLPTDVNLYHERCFLDFIKARTALIQQRMTGLFAELPGIPAVVLMAVKV